MPENHTELHELITEMEKLQTSQEEEMARMRHRLDWLEKRRREFYDIIARNSADFETQRRLEDVEQQHDQLQATLNQTDQELKSSMREIRQRIIAIRDAELLRIEQEIKTLRQRRDEIHTNLLPEALARVSGLQEEEAELDQRNEELIRRRRSLDGLELPTTQVA